MNEDDIELKREICSFLDDDRLVDPPECFYELYGAAGEDDLFAIKKEWNILIHFKENTPELLEELIENFMIFQKNILGRNLNSDLTQQITYELDKLQHYGLDIDLIIPNYRTSGSYCCNRSETWSYKEEKKKAEIAAWNRKLNSNPTVLWNVLDLLNVYCEAFDLDPFSFSKDRLYKKEVIEILELLKEKKIILDYKKDDIYCGEPTKKKVQMFDYEYGMYFEDYIIVPMEKAQGNSFQKDKKPFRVVLGDELAEDNFDNWPRIKGFW